MGSLARFRRGLQKEFICALNAAYDEETDGWWRRMADDPDLFLGVRNNFLNVYYHGNSLVRIRFEAGQLIGQTHYKYLLKPRSRLCYIPSTDGKLNWPEGLAGEILLQDLNDVETLKAASIPYAEDEKTGVHRISQNNLNIIDIEFKEKEGEDGQASDLRIDFAALQQNGAGNELVFFEAKHVSNGELRAKGTAEPQVIRQLRTYEQFLAQHRQELEASYRQICRNLIDLKGKGRPAPEIVKRVAGGASLKVSAVPRLVIFGFDEDQDDGAFWGGHRKKLIDALGRDRVLLRGNPSGFTRSISTL